MTDRYKFPHSDHLSPSQVTEYLACPLCFKLNRLDRHPKAVGVALPIGGAIHHVVETQRIGMLEGRDIDYDLCEVAVNHFSKSLEVDAETGGEILLDLGHYGSIGEAKDHTFELAEFVLPEIAKLDASRGLIAAELDLMDYEVANPWPFNMHGRIDALYGTDEEWVVCGADLKTSGKQAGPAFGVSLQMSIYRQFIPVQWFADVLAKTRAPSLRTYVLSDEGDEFVHGLVLDVADRIARGDFPPRPGFLCKYDHGGPTFSLTVNVDRL